MTTFVNELTELENAFNVWWGHTHNPSDKSFHELCTELQQLNPAQKSEFDNITRFSLVPQTPPAPVRPEVFDHVTPKGGYMISADGFVEPVGQNQITITNDKITVYA